jgi:hypothetical protein
MQITADKCRLGDSLAHLYLNTILLVQQLWNSYSLDESKAVRWQAFI